MQHIPYIPWPALGWHLELCLLSGHLTERTRRHKSSRKTGRKTKPGKNGKAAGPVGATITQRLAFLALMPPLVLVFVFLFLFQFQFLCRCTTGRMGNYFYNFNVNMLGRRPSVCWGSVIECLGFEVN